MSIVSVLWGRLRFWVPICMIYIYILEYFKNSVKFPKPCALWFFLSLLMGLLQLYQTIFRRVASYEGPEDFKQDVR